MKNMQNAVRTTLPVDDDGDLAPGFDPDLAAESSEADEAELAMIYQANKIAEKTDDFQAPSQALTLNQDAEARRS